RKDGVSFPDASAVDAWARPRLVTLDHEELWALALDGRNRLRAARRIAAGGLHGMHVLPRDVLRAMVREAASTFVLVHNHPSGDDRPSEEDVGFTLRVVEAARALGTPLVDHVVIGAPGYTSMLETGILK
ncbi:MAG: JAB domain-containing protein, partial [Polyangiaceae bacterium]